ncbi:MAG: type II secretion system GspH family protein [Helicobacteraceae bacterium]|jgi:prepilin-type N-terminal cleavage/methylation domain-containing protein|nr:type II secretion system GspH family protein [Helicobacteraceae bacterium]
MWAVSRAFTLIELLIVVALMAIIYALAAGSFKRDSLQDAGEWKLETLDLALKNAGQNEYLKLACEGEVCQNCRVVDVKGEEILADLTLFEEPPKAFYFDKNGYLEELKFPSDRCFEMELFENGAIGEALVEHKGLFYRYYSALRKAEIFASLDDAKTSYDPRSRIPQYSSEFFNELD